MNWEAFKYGLIDAYNVALYTFILWAGLCWLFKGCLDSVREVKL